MRRMSITNEWRGDFDNAALETLHGEGFEHPSTDYDWQGHNSTNTVSAGSVPTTAKR